MDKEATIDWQIDELGKYGRFIINSDIFNKIAVLKTAYWYTDLFYLKILSQSKSFEMIIRCKGDFDSNLLQKTSDEFRNKLIDYQLRQEIIAETQDIQELIIRKAFGEAAKTHTPSQMEITREIDIPLSGDTFEQDNTHIRDTV
ncbi:conserved hypothetical protein [methanotrophic bacterial endosymbiont of Bathymodiolus sp.]|nr:conserved hypothetical protein [methanotrophic bacterial endosymbiont of Bathymodiolus sp.]